MVPTNHSAWACAARACHPRAFLYRGVLIVLATLSVLALPAYAQYKCKSPAGGTTYQQTPCVEGPQEQIKVYAAPPDATGPRPNFKAQIADLDRKQAIRDAISRGQPLVGMTREELGLALGNPDELGRYLGGREQLIFNRGGRRLYVYVENGSVSAVQDTAGMPARSCPSAADIRDLEMERGKIANRGNDRLQRELAIQLGMARACRP